MKKTFFLVAIAFAIGSFLFFNINKADAVKPSNYGLKEGDLISAIFSDDPDVYIINDYGYKRLFLNPEIFKFYGHLGGFVNVKLVTPEVRDAFITSGLFRNCEDNDQRVFGVDIEGEDSGKLHWVNVPGTTAASEDPDFFKKTFCINNREFKWYPVGTEFKAVAEVPKYERMETEETIPTERKLETNIPLKEEGRVIICHYPPEAPNKFQEITIDASVLKAHLEHGDIVGACPPTPSVACTMDAKLCPDGSYVSRIGPECEFASCPAYPTPVPTPKPTCSPRPACLDATPYCLLSEPPGGWCPIYTPTPTPTQGYISVVSPNGGEVFQKGTTQLIKWNSANVSKIYIKLRKGNDTYPGPEGMITDVIPNVGGYYKWIIPTTLPDGNDYSVRIIDGNFTGMLDDSDAPFSIVSVATQTPIPAPSVSPLPGTTFIPSITILSPNGGEQWQTGNYYEVKWTNTTGKSVNLELTKGNNAVAGWSPIGSAVSVYNIGLPLPLEAGSDYRIRITTVDSGNVDSRDAPFSIVTTVTQTPVPTPTSTTIKPLRITSPNGGEQWTIGPEYTIQWENPGSVKSVYVDLYKGGVYLAGLGGLGYSYGGGPTSWTWNTIDTPNFIPGSDFKIRVRSDSDPTIYDESDNYFSISVSLPSPTTCDYLKSNSATSPYFNQCSSGGFDNTCFNKFYSTFQGCTRNTNNDCTVNNANASQNILCPVSNISTPTPTPITQSYFSRNLTIGSTGDDVKQLQALLVNEVDYPAGLLTGYFGRITRDAVKRFQAKYGVRPVSGYFGEITRKALSALISNW